MDFPIKTYKNHGFPGLGCKMAESPTTSVGAAAPVAGPSPAGE